MPEHKGTRYRGREKLVSALAFLRLKRESRDAQDNNRPPASVADRLQCSRQGAIEWLRPVSNVALKTDNQNQWLTMFS